MSSITVINSTDLITDSRAVINTNFSNLNTDKIETSYLDTDTTLAANSDTKIATQKAVKAYVDTGGNVNASETTKGLVEEATDAEVTAGTATGATGAKLFVTPAKLKTNITALVNTRISLTLGEAVTAGNALVVGNGTSFYLKVGSGVSGASITLTAGAETFGQTFTTSSTAKKVSGITLNLNAGNTTTNWVIKLYATSSGLPTGAALGSKSFTKDNSASQWAGVTFDTPITISPNTVYAITLTPDAGATTPQWNYANSDQYANGNYLSGGPSSWAIDNAKDFMFRVYEIFTVAGHVYLADADFNGSTASEFTDNFIGFAEESGTEGQSKNVVVTGINSSLTGLTVGATYYLSDTAGAIATSAGTVSRKIGIAISATEIILKHDNA
jgi:hypothetical protein